MKIKPVLPFAIVTLLFTSCAHVYSPALFHQDIAYQPKPASFDTAKSLTYVSGGLGLNVNSNGDDLLTSGQINVSRGHDLGGANISYGAFAVFGDYNNGTSSDDAGKITDFQDKFFGAIGGRASANLYVTTGRVDFRYIGVEAAYSHEFGAYADFRNTLNRTGGYYVDPRTDLLTLGLTTEVLFHNRNDKSFQNGIRGFLGTTLGHNPLEDTYYNDNSSESKLLRRIFPKASYFITFKRFFGTFEIGNTLFARFGYKF